MPPENITIRCDGVVTLLDLGVAKAEQSEHATKVDTVKGKLGYLSPEQARTDPLDLAGSRSSSGGSPARTTRTWYSTTRCESRSDTRCP